MLASDKLVTRTTLESIAHDWDCQDLGISRATTIWCILGNEPTITLTQYKAIEPFNCLGIALESITHDWDWEDFNTSQGTTILCALRSEPDNHANTTQTNQVVQ